MGQALLATLVEVPSHGVLQATYLLSSQSEQGFVCVCVATQHNACKAQTMYYMSLCRLYGPSSTAFLFDKYWEVTNGLFHPFLFMHLVV